VVAREARRLRARRTEAGMLLEFLRESTSRKGRFMPLELALRKRPKQRPRRPLEELPLRSTTRSS